MTTLDNRSVKRNAISLYMLQIANFAAPLAVLPYLSRILAIDEFGVTMAALSVIQICLVITDYGYTLSATNKISKIRENKEKVGELISTIYIIKCILVFVVFLVLVVGALTYNDANFIFLLPPVILSIVAQTFQPIWLFQGLERMEKVAIYLTATKVFYIILIYKLIERSDGAIAVLYAWAFSQIIGTIISNFESLKLGYRLIKPNKSQIKISLISSSSFFWSRIAVAVYTSGSTLVVGNWAGSAQAAIYAACEQLYKGGQNVTSPINNALYPFMVRSPDWKLFYKLFAIITLILIIICSIAAFNADIIISVVFGNKFDDGKATLVVFFAVVVINYITVTFGYPAFAAISKVEFANYTIFIGLCFNIIAITSLILIDKVSSFNVAICVLCTELIVMASRVLLFSFMIKMNKIKDKNEY